MKESFEERLASLAALKDNWDYGRGNAISSVCFEFVRKLYPLFADVYTEDNIFVFAITEGGIELNMPYKGLTRVCSIFKDRIEFCKHDNVNDEYDVYNLNFNPQNLNLFIEWHKKLSEIIDETFLLDWFCTKNKAFGNIEPIFLFPDRVEELEIMHYHISAGVPN